MRRREEDRPRGRGVGKRLLVLVGVVLCGVRGAQAASLESRLQLEAPKIIAMLHDRGCHRIGVLKFRVQRQIGGPLRDSVGQLNTQLANRLEAALVLAAPDDDTTQVRIARNASATAANVTQASHLTKAGRQRLHEHVYQAAWGPAPMEVDAFVTGVVEVAPDLRSMRVGVIAAVRDEPKLVPLTRFVADVDAGILSELGESYHLRSVGGNDQPDREPAAQALKVRDDPASNFPLRDKPLVALRIYYDGKPVDIEFKGIDAAVPEPREGQQVRLEIERLDDGAEELGVVLKVNGENTLYRQRRVDRNCSKWVLNQQHKKTVIRGFQEANSRGARFHINSREESEPLEMYYGEDVGLISMTVFVEQDEEPEQAEAVIPPDLAAIQNASFPAEPPGSLGELQSRLRGKDRVTTRGLITPGEDIEQRVYQVKRRWARQPLMSVVIRYYKPQAG